jgi:putative GTP pyrophosphokinase
MENEHFSLPHRLRLKKQYEARLPSYRALLSALKENIKQTLAGSELQFDVQGRLKSFDSYFEKMLRLQRASPGRRPDWEVNDLLGLRIVCLFLEDVQKAEQVLARCYEIVEIEDKARSYSFREFGYESVHMLAKVPRTLCLHHGFSEGLICEIQLRTILQQAWAEVEHELVYKGGLQPFEEHVKRKLAALKANLNLADTLFQEIRESQRVMQHQTRLRREKFLKTATSRVASSGSGQVPPGKGRRSREGNEKPEQLNGMNAGMMQRVDALLLKALHAHNNNDYEQAIAIYSSILKQKLPLRVRSFLYNHRGMAYFSNRRHQKALHDFSAAVSLYPENDRAFYYRGLIHQRLGRYDKSIEDFSSCLAINPYHVNALCSRARAYNITGDAKRAVADCAAALKLNPDSTEAQQLMAGLRTSP